MTFSEHLFYLRERRKLKQSDVADAIGITVRGYRNYERGTREPVMSTLIALADFYGISLDELVCRRREGEPSDGTGHGTMLMVWQRTPIFFLKHQKENGRARSKEKMLGANLHVRASSLNTGVFRIYAD